MLARMGKSRYSFLNITTEEKATGSCKKVEALRLIRSKPLSLNLTPEFIDRSAEQHQLMGVWLPLSIDR